MIAAARHVTIMAGGTGGHIMPGLAVAERLLELGHRVSWLGSARSMEQRLVPEQGLEFHAITIRGLRGAGAGRWVAMPWLLARSLWQALGILRRLGPDCVLSMGGYAAAPGGIAAWLLRLPLVIHEQNRVPGWTSRLLARLATARAEAFEHSFAAARKALPVGNPVRREIVAARAAATERLSRETLQVLVLGGSQGARAINLQLPAVLAGIARERGLRLRVWHQCGERWQADTEAAWWQHGADVPVTVTPFIKAMGEAYARADVVIARAGAMTVSELAAAGVAAVLVPYPHAVDDHQTANASVLAQAGAAVIATEQELASAATRQWLADLLADRERLAAMGRAAAGCHRHDAAGRLAELCLEVCA